MGRGLSVQAPSAVVMVRPHHFRPNPATMADNAFQTEADASTSIAQAAYDEVTRCAGQLQDAGVTVHLFEEEGTDNPDAVFPNNWFSTHAGGHVAIYPMFSPSRRRERRYDIIEILKTSYRVQDIVDFSGLEPDELYLEGTGSMVIDHLERIAYVARSNRANEVALERFCAHFQFEPMVFDTMGPGGKPIYHTNVMMSLGRDMCLIGADYIVDPKRRDAVLARLAASGRDVITLDMQQVEAFAGNAIELKGKDGPVLVMSSRGVDALTNEQKQAIEAHAPLLPVDVPVIEMAGGSVRCMIAAIHLSPRL